MVTGNLLIFLIASSAACYQISTYSSIDPLSIEGFYRLAAKNAIIFDTRLQAIGGLIYNSYWLRSDINFNICVPLVAKSDDPILLVVESGKSEQMATKMQDAGFSNILGYNGFEVKDYPGWKNFPKLIKGGDSLSISPRTHLDVRTVNEYRQKGVIEGAVLIPLAELSDKLQNLRGKENIIVNCMSGLRARFAYSLLKKNKIDSIVIDDEFDNFEGEGLKIVPYDE